MFTNKRAFTLVEIIIVVVILGVLAAIAIPKVVTSNEFVISGEGKQILTAILGSQQRYFQENNVYAANAGSLDIVIPSSTYFPLLVVQNPGAGGGNVAFVRRDLASGGQYRLWIDNTGVITCTDIVGGSCAAIQCNKGAGTQC